MMRTIQTTISKFTPTKNLNQLLLMFILLFYMMNAGAQTQERKWNFGILGGISTYAGGLGNGMLDFKLTDFQQNLLGGITVSRYINSSFDATLMGTYGTWGYYNTKAPNVDFKGNMLHSNISIKYKLNNGYLISENSWLAPYIFVGAGISSFTGDRINNNMDYPIVGGVGLRFRVTEVLSFNYQATFGFMSSAHNNPNASQYANGIAPTATGTDQFMMHTIGMDFNLGRAKDSDGDGVPDRRDKCEGTPKGVKVDANGCPFDTDGDGVPDYLDKCPNTPLNTLVDKNGCPDSDKDGVADNIDKCPNTPLNVKVDADGCPLDEDGDGVPDYLDKCSNTPKNVSVDLNGCPLDNDKDGVPDNIDKCPNTPANVQVDATGCPLDADKDGVPDYLDKCPNTPANAPVDKVGCPLDTDGDGIPDYLDRCPTIFGTAANQGCPEIKIEVKQLFEKALQGIQFETGKAIIKPVSFPILNAIVKVMKENPSYKLIIGGHTDDVGDDAMNMTLSQNRADAVANYLITNGVDPLRTSATGYGKTMPVDTNKSVKGRTRNRRVEFKVEFLK